MIICENCGSKRTGKSKFCGECGTKFVIDKKEMLLENQENLINTIKEYERKINTSTYTLNLLKDKEEFKKDYKELISNLEKLVAYNRDNIDEFIDVIFERVQKYSVGTDAIKELLNHSSFSLLVTFFESNVQSAVMQMNDGGIFLKQLNLQEKEDLIKKFRDNLDTHRDKHERNIEYYTKMEHPTIQDQKNLRYSQESLLIMQKSIYLQENGLLRDFLLKIIDDTLNKLITPEIKTYEPPNEESINLLEVADFALSMLSPVSAAKYFIKKMK